MMIHIKLKCMVCFGIAIQISIIRSVLFSFQIQSDVQWKNGSGICSESVVEVKPCVEYGCVDKNNKMHTHLHNRSAVRE